MLRSTRNQLTVLTDWQRLCIMSRPTRAERKALPKQIPHVFADPATLPTRLIKGRKFVRQVMMMN